jgi:protein-tyrosine-phosphatase
MPSVLFVCTANRFRSPIAAIYFAREVVRRGDDGNISVSSAGTWTETGQPVTPDALTQAKLYNINLSLHKSRPLTKDILKKSDLILVMENNHKEAILQEFPFCAERLYLLTEVAKGIPKDIPDPYVSEETPAVISEEIIDIIDQGYDQIKQVLMNKQHES